MFLLSVCLKLGIFSEQVFVSQWLRSSCARPSFSHSSSRLVKSAPLERFVMSFVKVESMDSTLPHQALDIPDSQLYSVSNVLFYAKNLIIDLFYVHLFISALADPVETI